MDPGEYSVPHTDPALMEEELLIYARELNDLYEAEKRARQTLAEEKLVLEYRLKELSALNRLLQHQLESQQRLEEVLVRVSAALEEVLAGSSETRLQPLLQRILALMKESLAPSEKPA